MTEEKESLIEVDTSPIEIMAVVCTPDGSFWIECRNCYFQIFRKELDGKVTYECPECKAEIPSADAVELLAQAYVGLRKVIDPPKKPWYRFW